MHHFTFRRTLLYFLDHLDKVLESSASNKMGIENISTVVSILNSLSMFSLIQIEMHVLIVVTVLKSIVMMK